MSAEEEEAGGAAALVRKAFLKPPPVYFQIDLDQPECFANAHHVEQTLHVSRVQKMATVAGDAALSREAAAIMTKATVGWVIRGNIE